MVFSRSRLRLRPGRYWQFESFSTVIAYCPRIVPAHALTVGYKGMMGSGWCRQPPVQTHLARTLRRGWVSGPPVDTNLWDCLEKME
eukprot:273029-Hanusia_phi.AAC.2